MDGLLYLLFQLFIDLFGQIILELIWETCASAYKGVSGRPNWSGVAAPVGLFVAGSVVGGLTLVAWPDRVFRPGPLPGLSLVVSPLCVGLAMQGWGALRRARGHATSSVATFWGGAAFALGTALVRFLWAR